MKRFALNLPAIALAAAFVTDANAAPVFDQNVTNNVITGTGINNGGFTVNTVGDVEIGLRARERYPNPNQNTNSNGDGTYNHATGGYFSNFDWSINTGSVNISQYTYLIGIDYNPGFGTSFNTFDMINGVNPNPAAGGLALWDHSFGTNATAQSAGVEATGATLAVALADYNLLESSNNLVQNSWNLAFFSGGPFAYDPNANGNYSIFLEVYRAGTLVGRTDIEVIVGTGAVPEPGSLALVGLALAGLAAAGRRKACC
jgi:PEP-CTERM motif